MARKRREFSREFKLEAVRLLLQRESAGGSLASVSRELGVGTGVLRRWKQSVSKSESGSGGRSVFPGNGKLTSQDEELRRLRRENAILREEAAFAKKAAVFFAKESR